MHKFGVDWWLAAVQAALILVMIWMTASLSGFIDRQQEIELKLQKLEERIDKMSTDVIALEIDSNYSPTLSVWGPCPTEEQLAAGFEPLAVWGPTPDPPSSIPSRIAPFI